MKANNRLACRACSSSDSEIFFSLRALPVHGTAVCETAEAARAAMVADQVLAVCHRCGFVFNTVFEPTLLDYSGQHEESQIHSPTFRKFAEQLAAEWVHRWKLTGEAVLEVGCGGRADFAHVLVRAGVGHVHGVDPSVSPDAADGSSISIERAPFSASGWSRTARAIVCRHTLEHVPDVSDFLGEIVGGIDPQSCAGLLFEVPDFGNILAKNAFWDLHYEHCSNFCATSLAALFRHVGCDVADLRTVYGGQYLVIEARPAASTTGQPAPAADAVEGLVEQCRRFARNSAAKLEELEGLFHDAGRAGREIVVWGGGAKASVLLNTIKRSNVERVVDINPGLQGRFLVGAGLPLIAPDALKVSLPWAVMVMNPIYSGEVRQTLDKHGLEQVKVLNV